MDSGLLTDILKNSDSEVMDILSAKKTVVEKDKLDPENLPSPGSNTWHKFDDVVAVVVDLKGSSRLDARRHDKSTASIYHAATGRAVSILHSFSADFIDIQGDGGFALFSGDLRYERAMCAGITVKTFSERHLVPRLTEKWDDDPVRETGFKVGIASSALLAARVGVPRVSRNQEPVWAGRAVNYATKAAQEAQRHQLVVTASVWEKIKENQFLTYTCDCGKGPADALWADITIQAIPEERDDHDGRLLSVPWCINCGDSFCASIMNGETVRSNVQSAIAARSLEKVRSRKREDRLRRQRGLR